MPTEHGTAERVARPCAHAVAFYDTDAELVSVVADHLAAGLRAGEHVVIVADPGHRAAVSAVLREQGFHLSGDPGERQFVELDAADTLARIRVDGRIDPEAFRDTVEPLIVEGLAAGRRVRIYGEMVAILWERGDLADALDLEACWNDLARTATFALLCGYRAGSLGAAALTEVARVCALHGEVSPPRSYEVPDSPATQINGTRSSKVFLPLAAAVPAARRFVADTLASWGEPAVCEDADLVTSELTSNAVLGGGSPIRVSLARLEEVVRLEVEDLSPAEQRHGGSAPDDLPDRGRRPVGGPAGRTGCDARSVGKVTWAELAL